MQYFQMFCQQNTAMMGMNPGMMGMNQGMGMNPGMMGMNQGMFGTNNNPDPNYIRNMLISMGYNEIIINNFINALFPNNQQNQPQPMQQTQQNINNGTLNFLFKHKTTGNTYTIIATNDETIGSVISKYINKSGDTHINLYIQNGKKLNESLTVAESGLINSCQIDIVPIDELEGALIK